MVTGGATVLEGGSIPPASTKFLFPLPALMAVFLFQPHHPKHL